MSNRFFIKKWYIAFLFSVLANCFFVMLATAQISHQKLPGKEQKEIGNPDPGGEGDNSEGEDLKFSIKPFKTKCIYTLEDAIGYNIMLQNLRKKETQNGTLTISVINNTTGKEVLLYNDEFKLVNSKSYNKKFAFEKQDLTPGFYKTTISINSDFYEDTLRYVFGISPESIVTQTHEPKDFDAFWDKTKAELAAIAPNYKVTKVTTDPAPHMNTYLVEFKSLGNITIKGWLTVPKEKKKYPVIYRVPGYKIIMNPEDGVKEDFAVFRVNVRGVGNSKSDFVMSDNEYMVQGLYTKESYIYRGVYMDCLRGLDFIFSHTNLGLDPTKVVIEGGSQGGTLALIISALDDRLKACSAEVPLFADMRGEFAYSAWQKVTPWPTKDFVNYLRSEKSTLSRNDFFNIWDYFEPMNFVSRIKCPVLMGIALLDKYNPPQSVYALFNQVGTPEKEMYVAPDKDHELGFTFFMYLNIWYKEILRVP